MKKYTLLALVMLLSATILWSQTPNEFSYQAVARTSAGVVMEDQNITVEISIMESGSAVYTEEHAVTTNQFGLFTLNIGGGSATLGDFTTIDWTSGSYGVQVAMDENAGTTFVVMGTSPLLTVPFAMHAKTAETVENIDDADANPTNELQNLSVSVVGDTLYLTQGNWVIIPGISIANQETVIDFEGNTYTAVTIGNQIWMNENLKSTFYADGTEIPYLEGNSNWSNLADDDVSRAYCWYGDDSLTYASMGALYSYAAATNGDNSANNVQGVCPMGWHLPSDAEWKELEMYLGMSEADANDDTADRGSSQNIGSKFAVDPTLWVDGPLESNPDFGTSGFNVRPTGYRYNGTFWYVNEIANFWVSDEFDATNAWRRGVYQARTGVDRYEGSDKSTAYSVRCVKN